MNSSRKFLLISIFLLVGSSNPVAIKFALSGEWPPFLLGFCRMGCIGLFYGIWVCAKRGPLFGPNREAVRYSLVSGLFKGVAVILLYMGLSNIPASRVVIITTFSPILNLLMVHLLLRQEKITFNTIVGVVVSFAGIIMLLVWRENAVGEPEIVLDSMFFGDVAMVLNVLIAQGMIIYEKKAFNCGASPRQLLHSTTVFSLAAFGCCFLLSGESLTDFPTNPKASMAFLYLITVTGVFLFYYRRSIASKLDVTFINSFCHLGKAISIFYAYLFLGEKVPLMSILAFCVILCGTAFALRGSKKQVTGSYRVFF